MILTLHQKASLENLVSDLLVELFPIHRSLAGEGIRNSLSIVREILPSLQLNSFQSGQKVFDWQVPDEWVVNEAWLKNSKGEKL